MSQVSNRQLLLDNPLLLLNDYEPNFRLDDASLAALQQIRNEVALEKLNFQCDVNDPQYALKTLRLLAFFDGNLNIIERLMALHLNNTTPQSQE